MSAMPIGTIAAHARLFHRHGEFCRTLGAITPLATSSPNSTAATITWGRLAYKVAPSRSAACERAGRAAAIRGAEHDCGEHERQKKIEHAKRQQCREQVLALILRQADEDRGFDHAEAARRVTNRAEQRGE